MDYGKNRIPLDHEYGQRLAMNFHHFEALQNILLETIHLWKGCGSYLMDGNDMKYADCMYPKQVSLYEAAKDAKHVFEVGVHGGHSLLIMLLANPCMRITCLDICYWIHTEKCIEYLRSAFPNATIVLYKGDSRDVLASVDKKIFDEYPLDLAHIDATHELHIIEQETKEVLKIVRPGKTLVYDDYQTNGLPHAISHTWKDQMELIRVPQCPWTHCVVKRL